MITLALIIIVFLLRKPLFTLSFTLLASLGLEVDDLDKGKSMSSKLFEDK